VNARPYPAIVSLMASGRLQRDVEIVFVCTGNRARSPLAEALLRERTSGLPARVASRGTSDVGRAPVLEGMASAAARLGIDLSRHRATPIAPMELRDTDLVIGFEPFHVAAAVVDGGAARERTFTLPDLVELVSPLGPDASADLRERFASVVTGASNRRGSTHWSAGSIADPLGASSRVFDETAMTISSLVTQLADALFVGVEVVSSEATA
jgi:low molecular weight protein-tyrosine phosphatase